MGHRDPTDRTSAGPAAARRILIPTELAASDLPALVQGLELARSQRAAVTVLHVRPVVPERSVHWLDAIERLHRADHQRPATGSDSFVAWERDRARIREFLEREIPESLRHGIPISIESDTGDVAESIARRANALNADVIVMSRHRSRWRFSILPAIVRRVLERCQSQVLLAHSETRFRADAGLNAGAVPTAC